MCNEFWISPIWLILSSREKDKQILINKFLNARYVSVKELLKKDLSNN